MIKKVNFMLCIFYHNKKKDERNFPGGPVAKTPNARGLGLIPGQGTRSHMSQLRPGTGLGSLNGPEPGGSESTMKKCKKERG